MNWWALAAFYLGVGLAVACKDWAEWAPREPSFYAWPRARVILFAVMFFAMTVLGWPVDVADWVLGVWRRRYPKPVTGRRGPGS
jgi:hypothetical protein